MIIFVWLITSAITPQSQGEKQVSAHFEAAFPIAAVILGVWSRHPNLGDFLLSHFHDVCPILVPLQIPTPPKISEKDFKKCVLVIDTCLPMCVVDSSIFSCLEYNNYFMNQCRLLSYRSSNNGLEDDSDYLKRMSGVVRLYAALVQSPSVVWGKVRMVIESGGGGEAGVSRWIQHYFVLTQDNPLGIGSGWRWFALMLNTDPLPGITATALFDFLEVCCLNGNGLSYLEEVSRPTRWLGMLC